MIKYIIFFFCFSFSSIFANTENNYKSQIIDLVSQESNINLSVSNSKPNRRITNLMMKIDEIAKQIMSLEASDKVIELSQKCLSILSTLRERRVYAYMLWAEGILEWSSSGNNVNLQKKSQIELIQMYDKLSDINISIVTENMLNREIMTRLAQIYDELNFENKKKVRLRAIHKQRDILSQVEIQRRRSLDDF